MSDNREEFVKVILLGESGVGKTNLINIFTGGEFNENEAVSLTSSFLLKKIIKNTLFNYGIPLAKRDYDN